MVCSAAFCSGFGLKVSPRYDNSVLRDNLAMKSVKQGSPWQHSDEMDLFGRQWSKENIIFL